MSSSIVIEGPRAPFRAEVTVPGDKSMSHRAFLLAAMADGRSIIHNAGPGRDVAATRDVITRLGARPAGDEVVGPGVGGWTTPEAVLDCANSGTTLRLTTGVVAGAPFETTLSGDESLRRRPMGRLVAPLEALGATVSLGPGGLPPVTIGGSSSLQGADVAIPIASAQVRSAFTLAAIQAEGPSTITSPVGFRDHTERWLETMGLGERISPQTFRIHPGKVPPFRYVIPGDPSSAAFLWAAAALIKGATVTTPGISLNAGRIGFLQVLEAMGAIVDGEVTGAILGDPVGTVTVTGHGLSGTVVGGNLTAATLDELPLVAVVGSFAEGITRVEGASELRAKESDRIDSTVAMIRALGGGAEPRSDGFDVLGIGWLDAGTVNAAGDHRIAMAAAVAATAARGPVRIIGGSVAGVSWPGFYDELGAAWSSR